MDEFRLLKQYTPEKGKVVEFGSGGSTVFFLKHGLEVYSVENHKPFYHYLSGIPYIRRMIGKRKLKYLFVDTGATGDWGYPVDTADNTHWPAYYRGVWSQHGSHRPDLLFIDGRFRVMCLLSALQYISSETWVVVHDFWDRPEYHAIHAFYTPIARSGTLAVFQKTATIDEGLYRQLSETHASAYR